MLYSFAKETPANFPQKFKLHLVHINEIAIGRFKGFLVVLFLSVSSLLVLACVNVAILMPARGEARQAEIAMRKALGALGAAGSSGNCSPRQCFSLRLADVWASW